MKHKLLFVFSLFALTSCGTKFNELGPYGMDHSTNWQDNYYTYFDAKLAVLPTETISLDKDANKVFTSYADPNFIAQESRAAGEDALIYYDDDTTDGFGQTMKLSNVNSYVKEGVTSKLFDGRMFCYSRYEKVRVQINQNGFTCGLGKKLVSSDYLYLHFKSSLDFKSHQVDMHKSDITIKITFYSNEKGITYSYPLTDILSNAGESYYFYGFSTKDLDLNNATSFAISYTLDKDEYNIEKGVNYDHALLLYEFGFKNPTFQ